MSAPHVWLESWTCDASASRIVGVNWFDHHLKQTPARKVDITLPHRSVVGWMLERHDDCQRLLVWTTAGTSFDVYGECMSDAAMELESRLRANGR